MLGKETQKPVRLENLLHIELNFIKKTDLVTERLNYISNLQNLYLVLRNIKLLLYYIY